jgi:hypothetical protein
VSPDVSTQVQLIIPGEVQPGEDFRVVTLITNNSTQPNNIVDLVPIIKNNSTLTQIDGPLPPSIKTLPRGNTATFTSTYVAPDAVGGILFNATYTGAPDSALVNSNMTVALSAESEAATNSQWSQAASRVGILISGIPNPMETSGGSSGSGKWGIGIINPLDRPVDIYAVSISMPGGVTKQPITGATGVEPFFGWDFINDMVVWHSDGTPYTIEAESVAQFRVKTTHANEISAQEALTMIQVLSSEGKLNAIYGVSTKGAFQTINMYYTNNTSSPASPDKNWGYLIPDIPSGKVGQIFNATVENASTSTLDSNVKLIILVPSDFNDVRVDGTLNATNAVNWGPPNIVINEDGSSVVTVETNSTCTGDPCFEQGAAVFQFMADAPTLSDVKLYVFQTTSVYPQWDITDSLQVASALSESGVQVVP